MAQANLLFIWELESFNEITEDPNLLKLHNEFKMRGHLLSRSLLIWEKVGVAESRLLADFRNEKIYHIQQRNNPEMEVLETPWDPENLRSRFEDETRGTKEGFIDWLKLFKLAESDLEQLKRTDLLERKLDLEMAHEDLLAAYELLREILTSPREWLIGLSENDIQRIRKSLDQWYKTARAIHNISLSTAREKHTEVLQQIFRFSDEVKQQLGQVVTYLKSKKSEQLETRVSKTFTEAVEKVKTETDLLQKQREEAERNETERQKEFNELQSKLRDKLAKETVSKHSQIFKKQADEHKQASKIWLIATGGLIVAFGGVFYWLFEALRLGGTEWVGVLQNVFTKGFLLTLIYFVINRFSKNYTAQKHLEVVNRHRQNALETFDNFFETAGNNQEIKEAVLLAATNAIFDANQSGYLSSKMKGTESVNPVKQVFGTIGGSPTKSDD